MVTVGRTNIMDFGLEDHTQHLSRQVQNVCSRGGGYNSCTIVEAEEEKTVNETHKRNEGTQNFRTAP